MPSSTRRTLVAHAVGLALYLGGMLLFLSVVVGTFLGEPPEGMGEALAGSMPVLLVGVALIVLGRVISWKYGGPSAGMFGWGVPPERGPKQSRLEQLGYRVPPDDDAGGDTPYAYEDGTVYVVCSSCGAKNSGDFRFCSNCSSELPE